MARTPVPEVGGVPGGARGEEAEEEPARRGGGAGDEAREAARARRRITSSTRRSRRHGPDRREGDTDDEMMSRPPSRLPASAPPCRPSSLVETAPRSRAPFRPRKQSQRNGHEKTRLAGLVHGRAARGSPRAPRDGAARAASLPHHGRAREPGAPVLPDLQVRSTCAYAPPSRGRGIRSSPPRSFGASFATFTVSGSPLRASVPGSCLSPGFCDAEPRDSARDVTYGDDLNVSREDRDVARTETRR